MPSVFGWVDFLEKDREKMINVINLFKEQDTRDELGLGSVRDAFSNLFFPGTSTIQTRAKYMLFVPWIYRELERQKTRSNEIFRRARSMEISLIYSLLESGETEGVIGRDSKETLQRLPSNIYWAGLGTWGIRLYDGSQEGYHRYLDMYYRFRDNQVKGDDKEPVSGRIRENWDPGLPEPPGGFPGKADFDLEKNEAEYLYDRVLTSCSGSLLSFLIRERLNAACDFIWFHPELGSFPQKLRTQVEHARNFSEVMYGSTLLYNLMLAEKTGMENKEELVKYYTDEIFRWKEDIGSRIRQLTEWHREINKFWDIVLPWGNVSHGTKKFVETWIYRVLNDDSFEKPEFDEVSKRLVYDREVALKRGRARLADKRALERWTGAAGAYQLHYRWRVVKNIVSDIIKGLTK